MLLAIQYPPKAPMFIDRNGNFLRYIKRIGGQINYHDFSQQHPKTKGDVKILFWRLSKQFSLAQK
jgi:hypothetical protein